VVWTHTLVRARRIFSIAVKNEGGVKGESGCAVFVKRSDLGVDVHMRCEGDDGWSEGGRSDIAERFIFSCLIHTPDPHTVPYPKNTPFFFLTSLMRDDNFVSLSLFLPQQIMT
jgi:hypothetical protein